MLSKFIYWICGSFPTYLKYQLWGPLNIYMFVSVFFLFWPMDIPQLWSQEQFFYCSFILSFIVQYFLLLLLLLLSFLFLLQYFGGFSDLLYFLISFRIVMSDFKYNHVAILVKLSKWCQTCGSVFKDLHRGSVVPCENVPYSSVLCAQSGRVHCPVELVYVMVIVTVTIMC